MQRKPGYAEKTTDLPHVTDFDQIKVYQIKLAMNEVLTHFIGDRHCLLVSAYHLIYYVYFNNHHSYTYKMYMKFVFRSHIFLGPSWWLLVFSFNVVVIDYLVPAITVRSIRKTKF